MTDRLAGQVAVVTGASSGLGVRFAKVLAAEGAGVALAARRLDRLQGLRDEITAAGGRAVALALDVADVGAFDAVFRVNLRGPFFLATACARRWIAREWARFGIAVNGLAPGHIRTEINEDVWDRPAGAALLAGFPRRRVGEPEDLDGALLLMAGP